MSEVLASLARQYLNSIAAADPQQQSENDAVSTVDMSQLQQPQALQSEEGAPEQPTPPPQQAQTAPMQQQPMQQQQQQAPQQPFQELPQRQVPVSNDGRAYSQQGQDLRASIDRNFTDAQNLTAQGLQDSVTAETHKAIDAGVAAALKQPVYDKDAQEAHEMNQAYEHTLGQHESTQQELRARTFEALDKERAAIQQRPTGAFFSGDNQRKAMGIVNVLLAVGGRQGAGALMSSLNNLFVADATEQARYDARLKEYQMHLHDAGVDDRAWAQTEKSSIEMRVALQKQQTVAQLQAAVNQMAPGEAQTAALENIAKLKAGAAKNIEASANYRAEALIKNEDTNIKAYEATNQRIAALATREKAEHAGQGKFVASDEAMPTDGSPGFDPAVYNEKTREKVDASQAVLKSMKAIREKAQAGKITNREAQLEMIALMPNYATSKGVNRHSDEVMHALQSGFGLNPGDRVTNWLSGVDREKLWRQIEDDAADTIERETKLANPSAKLIPGGSAYEIRQRRAGDNKALKDVTDIVEDKKLQDFQKIGKLSLLTGNPYAAEALKKFK